MSGLFDSLAARFASNSQPAIRPRPLSRFEDSAQGRSDEGPLEQESEHMASAPRPAPAPDRPARSRPGPAMQDAPAGGRQRGSDTPPAQPAPEPAVLSQHDAAADTPAPPIRARRRVQAIPDENQAPETPAPVSPVSGQTKRRPEPDTATRAPSQPAEPPAITGTTTERIIETRRDAPEPAAAPRREPESTASEAARDEAPAAIPDSPVIRIGRIEVTRPAPPAPSPAPTQAVRPQPPRRAAPAARARQASGLTDYLGWKKK